MPADIFVSYTQPDLEFIKQLQQDLTARGFSIWFDTEEKPGPMHNLINLDPMIRECKVLLLVLSLNALASKDIEDHLHRAKNLYTKPIIPVIWQAIPGNLPRLWQNYLVGTERIDFAGTASVENLNKLANTLAKYINTASPVTFTPSGGAGEVAGVTIGSATKTVGVPVQGESPASAGRRLGALVNKSTATQPSVNPLALGAQVISLIIVPLELNPVDEERVKGEMRWLFSAVDHLLKSLHNEILRSQPIVEPVPPHLQTLPEVNHQPLVVLNDDDLENLRSDTSSRLKILNSFLNNLRILLDKETQKGEEGKGDSYLQSGIKDTRIQILNTIQKVSQNIYQAYSIKINSPDQLLEILEGRIGPILFGTLVISKVIIPLGLSSEDEAFVTAEVKWLFSAADNYQNIYQTIQNRLITEVNELKDKLGAQFFRAELITQELTKLLPIIRQEELERSPDLKVAIPSEAQKSSQSVNRLLNIPDENDPIFYLEGSILAPQKNSFLTSRFFNRFNSYLQGLDILLKREAKMGEEGKRNIELQNDLKNNRLYIIKVLQEMAQQMSEAYGVLVTTPTQLLELLET